MLKLNKQVVLIGTIGLIAIVLMGIYALVSQKNKSNQGNGAVFVTPQVSPYVAPTSSTPLSRPLNLTPFPTSAPKNYSYAFADYRYPLQYEDIVIDYTPGRQLMRVYYDQDQHAAYMKIKKFFAQFGFEDPMFTGIRITFLGKKQ